MRGAAAPDEERGELGNFAPHAISAAKKCDLYTGGGDIKAISRPARAAEVRKKKAAAK